LEALNTPIAVLAVTGVVVAFNAFLFFGYYLPRTTNPTAPASPQIERTPLSTTVQRTRPTTNMEQQTTTSIIKESPSKEASKEASKETPESPPTATATATATATP
jgi:hypothetical protein